MINSNHKELNTWHFRKKGTSKKESISIEPVKLSDDGEIIRLWALEGMGSRRYGHSTQIINRY
ncbi:hypothetical protein PPBDW_II1263 [Photobacterium kishitanii]|nr:hypothetical protein PPBDW_II1263 [Photobacterium kishitanii]